MVVNGVSLYVRGGGVKLESDGRRGGAVSEISGVWIY